MLACVRVRPEDLRQRAEGVQGASLVTVLACVRARLEDLALDLGLRAKGVQGAGLRTELSTSGKCMGV